LPRRTMRRERRSVAMDPAVEVERRDDHCVVTPHGDLDVSSLSDLVPAMDQALERNLDVVLDLTDVPFVDLAFVRAVLDAQARIADHGHRLTIHNPPHSLLRL